MINFEPAMLGADRRRTRADASDVPSVPAAKKLLVPTPMQQVRRSGQPHFRSCKGRRAVRPMQRVELAAYFFREQHYVFVFWTKKDSMTLEGFEIPGRSQRGSRSVP